MSLLLEPVIIGKPFIIDLNNCKNNLEYDMKTLGLNGKIIISNTDNINIKLLHIINNTLHYYSKNVVIDKINKCVVVYLMGVPPPPESKRIEKEPYVNNKRVEFNSSIYNKIIFLNTEFFGYCDDLEDPADTKDRLKDEKIMKNKKIYQNYTDTKNKLKQKKIREENKILLEKAKIYEEIIPKDKDMNNTFFGIDNFEQNELNK